MDKRAALAKDQGDTITVLMVQSRSEVQFIESFLDMRSILYRLCIYPNNL